MKRIITWFKQRGMQLLRLEKDRARIALGGSLGIYIAFSPFIGFHTAMTLVCAWLLGLNAALLFTVSMLINNPWTMLPVYGAGYWFGEWLFSLVGIDPLLSNPSWMVYCNAWLQQYMPWDGFSFWAFMVGGNVLGILLALMSYPLIIWLVKVVGINHKERVFNTMRHSKKAVISLKEKAVPMIQRVTEKSRVRKTAYENSGTK